MTKIQIEVITSVQRRRRWTAVEKEQRVAASMEPGAVVRHGGGLIRANCMAGGVPWALDACGVLRQGQSILRPCGSHPIQLLCEHPFARSRSSLPADTDADQRRGRRGDPISGGRGPGDEGSVAMIEVPAAQRVAAGHGLRRDECRGVLQILASASCAARSIWRNGRFRKGSAGIEKTFVDLERSETCARRDEAKRPRCPANIGLTQICRWKIDYKGLT